MIAVFGSALELGLIVLNGGAGPYQWQVAALGLVMPCMALLMAYAFRNALVREWGENSTLIFFLSVFFLVSGVGVVAISTSLAFEPGQAWRKGVVLAIPFWLACAAIAGSLSRTIMQPRLWLLGSLLLGLAYLYGGALIALGNRWLDHNSPTVYQLTVIRKQVLRSPGRGGGTYYAVTLPPWGPIANDNDLVVPRSDYATIEPGRSLVCMAVYPGAFGIAWRQQVPCAG